MLQLNRRKFLGAILALAGGGVVYKTLVYGRPGAGLINDRSEILREAVLGLKGIGFDNPPGAQLITFEERILARGWSDVKTFADFYAWIGETVRNEFLGQKTVNLNGWIVSEFERDMIFYALLVKSKEGISVKENTGSFESAKMTDFLHVKDWGPRSTCVGMSFNPQSDGHSSHWFSTDSYNGRLAIYIGGEAIRTTKGVNIITTKVEGADLTKITSAPGALDVIAYDPARNIKQRIGVFEVFSQPPHAFTMEGKKSNYFGEVSGWGPKSMTLNQFTGAQKVPLWIKTSCAPISTVISLGDIPLKTVVGPNLVTGTFDVTVTEIKIGKFDIALIDRKSGEAVFVGELEITE